MLHKLSVLYFSPTGGTRTAALLLARSLAKEVIEIDLSLKETTAYSFTESDMVILAAPVYGGRIPAYMADKLKACTGNAAIAITAVVYGGRAYEDALLELNDCAEAQGFQVAASAVLLAEHSIIHTLAAGRPDAEDAKWIQDCAHQILSKLETVPTQCTPPTSSAPFAKFTVPGAHPYKEWTNMPAVPLTTDTCTNCCTCISQCPTQAIASDTPKLTDPQSCILCMRCVTICPTHSKLLPPPMMDMLTQKLAPFQSLRQPNELYL